MAEADAGAALRCTLPPACRRAPHTGRPPERAGRMSARHDLHSVQLTCERQGKCVARHGEERVLLLRAQMEAACLPQHQSSSALHAGTVGLADWPRAARAAKHSCCAAKQRSRQACWCCSRALCFALAGRARGCSAAAAPRRAAHLGPLAFPALQLHARPRRSPPPLAAAAPRSRSSSCALLSTRTTSTIP
jgi:hypothetical protein